MRDVTELQVGNKEKKRKKEKEESSFWIWNAILRTVGLHGIKVPPRFQASGTSSGPDSAKGTAAVPFPASQFTA